jgi:hypothetical protein
MTPTSPHRWNTKLVRDLEWALASPAVFSPGDGPLRKIVPLAQSRAWLGSLDACPQPLLDFIVEQQQDGKGTALGFYFAQLIEYWIRFCPVLSPLAVRVNVPIKAASGLGTVGQLKFLVQHADLERGSAAECDPSTQLEVSGVPRLYHWEASVKYFLHASTPNGGNVTAGGRALRHAAGGKTPDKLRDVLATGEWPTGAAIDAAVDGSGKSALHHAAWRGCLANIEALLEHGADLERWSTGQYSYGKTPIFFALTRSRNDAVQLLVRRGANLRIVNNKGQTPLSLAASHCTPETIELLKQAEDAQVRLPIEEAQPNPASMLPASGLQNPCTVAREVQ